LHIITFNRDLSDIGLARRTEILINNLQTVAISGDTAYGRSDDWQTASGSMKFPGCWFICNLSKGEAEKFKTEAEWRQAIDARKLPVELLRPALQIMKEFQEQGLLYYKPPTTASTTQANGVTR
jgi:hypothetical protein